MQADLETTLAKLISIPSVSNDATRCHEILEYVRGEIEPYGLFITSMVDTPNPWLIATTQASNEPDILLAAHLDVVPAPAELFTMKKQDGKLYGRGVYDMKFAAACYLEFFKTHIEKLRELSIGFLFTTDEEIGGGCMPTILNDGWRPKVVFIPDGGDNWRLEKRAKGLYLLELVAHGKTAHSSRPWEGENALHTLVDAIQTIRTHYPSVSEQSGATLSVTQLHTQEVALTQIPDYASATIGLRSFNNQELIDFHTFTATVAKRDGLDLNPIVISHPLLFDATHPRVQSFIEALKKQSNQTEIHYNESYGASDARYFAQYNIPCIIIEPYGGGRHGPDEWLRADDLLKYYDLIERWLLPQPSSSFQQTTENWESSARI